MQGRELADRVRRRFPAVRVLYQTGFSDRLFENRAELEEGEAFVEKPFGARSCAKRCGWSCSVRLIRKQILGACNRAYGATRVRRAVRLALWLLLFSAGAWLGSLARPQNGLRAAYHANLTRSGPPIAAVDREPSTLTLRTGTASGWSHFAVEWIGFLLVPEPESTFSRFPTMGPSWRSTTRLSSATAVFRAAGTDGDDRPRRRIPFVPAAL